MSKRTQRAIARREFFGGRKPSKLSSMTNSFGHPIGKKLCIRSMRRYYRVHHRSLHQSKSEFNQYIVGYAKSDVYRDCAAKRVAREVRHQNVMMVGCAALSLAAGGSI